MRAIAEAEKPGLDRIMGTPEMRKVGRSLRSLVLPVLVFLVCMQVFEIALMGFF